VGTVFFNHALKGEFSLEKKVEKFLTVTSGIPVKRITKEFLITKFLEISNRSRYEPAVWKRFRPRSVLRISKRNFFYLVTMKDICTKEIPI
jgi:predicted nucleotidyltransferase